MKIYKLDKKKWQRCDETVCGLKIPEQEKYCCVGLALIQDGIAPDELEDVASVEDMFYADKKVFKKIPGHWKSNQGKEAAFLTDLYSINDSEDIRGDVKRVKLLNKHLEESNVDIRFELS
jgi:hypothetical protein